MDATVVAAMAKWPNVPAVFGWLALTARGEWRLKGERVEHAGLGAFFSRNYEHDERGRYFVQNGPQRIFVELQCAPYVAKREAETWQRVPDGLNAPAQAAFVTPQGELFVEIDGRLALVDDREWLILADCVLDGAGRIHDEITWPKWLQGEGEAFLALPEGRLALTLLDLPSLLARFGVEPKPAP